jgi:hypothetical protein
MRRRTFSRWMMFGPRLSRTSASSASGTFWPSPASTSMSRIACTSLRADSP